ncbi:hypothetical protein MVES1_002338 [Malassezia vespertilionis]|uniref:Paf1p n=1 Tax=Malassezia vespertilionis TaxID=2020962 RepID=A0A2N1JCC7_9BASI|nr:uncharacterized protein MVES1_002338 [Malassezia vespertilionis]PKI84194.1 hypothetical protein MVES_002205 [Malassezia vespertilionis]WFD06983.1 hypothetical protein MVES1_002338 [Malassezia vespertilionis]
MAARRKRDLVERVRYPNPIPDLPFAPKLIRVAAPEPNYTSPVYAQRIAESQQLPVAVDAEAGMPLDLARIEYLWLENGKLPAGATDALDMDALDPDDAFLLSEQVAAHPVAAADTLPGSYAAAKANEVTWLRRTEYLGAEQRKQRAHAQPVQRLDTSRAAQIARIEESFVAANTALDTLTHPSKPGVHAVDAYELLPDPETWASSFQVVRFTSALGRMSQGAPDDDVRMRTAVLRPVTDAVSGQQRVSMYLACADELPQYTNSEEDQPQPTWDSATAQRRENLGSLRYEKRRRLGTFPRVPWLEQEDASGDANEYATGFRHARDLEPVEQVSSAANQLVLVLDDNIPDPAPQLDDVSVSGTIAEQLGKEDDLFGDEMRAAPPKDAAPTTTLPPQSAPQRARQESVLPSALGRKAAYYHRVDMRYALRIRRQRRAEQHLAVPYEGFWHRIILGNRSPTEREVCKELHARQAVDKVNLDGVEYASSDEEAEDVEALDKERVAAAEVGAQGQLPVPHMDETAVADDTVSAEAQASAADQSDAAEEQMQDYFDEDESSENASDVDGDAELAALRAEAQDADADDSPVPARRRRAP